ncbi:MAG: 16S rRNA (guanine(966)-N(2))-methyltransferase RsmD [Micrococcales bacterium]
MTRIIGGVAGSLKLAAPAKSTRPTSDRVRESIFNRLEAQDLIDDAKVLDLYAGTGALGLESISRGAQAATLVEGVKAASEVCRKNADAVAKATSVSARVVSQTVKTFLGAVKPHEFNLVFIDPPYDVTNAELIQNLEHLIDFLMPGTTVIVERSSRTAEPEWPKGFSLELRKDYGDTSVYWLSN